VSRFPRMLVNGTPGTSISAADRGLNYGDGVFETIAVDRGEPLLWQRHMARLEAGCRRLGLEWPAETLLRRESREMLQPDRSCVLKILLTRGEGGRGYAPPRTAPVTRILGVHPLPHYPGDFWERGVSLRVCVTRLGENPDLAGIKHLNRLEQVLARREWDDPAVSEGLMRDGHGRVIEGTFTNLFVCSDGGLSTPDLGRCGVAGVMRDLVMELAARENIEVVRKDMTLDEVKSAEALFLTNSLIGIWPVRVLDDVTFSPAKIPISLVRGVSPNCLRHALSERSAAEVTS